MNEEKLVSVDRDGVLRLDGLRLCAGCDDVFVVEVYCESCQQIHADLMRRYAAGDSLRAEMPPGSFDYRDEPVTEWDVSGAAAIGFLGLLFCLGVVAWYGIIYGLIALGNAVARVLHV